MEDEKPGDSFASTAQTPVTDATAAAAAAQFEPGSVYQGVIEDRQGDGTYTVLVTDPDQSISGVRLATPVFGGLLGMNVRCNLTKGTKVQLAYGSPAWIFAVIPSDSDDWLNAKSRSALWGPVADDAVGVVDTHSDNAEDLLEGESEISNLFGVSMEFLTTLIRMRSGDRAAVECHLINDMVRVISSQYRHVSGIGEDLIFDHGRPTMERGWTMYRHELMGKLKERDELAEMSGDEVDRDKLEEDRVVGMARHRLVEFIGFAGDFIHSFVQDPPKTIVKMTQDAAEPGAGKSMFHRNSDGSIIMQSVADIRFERVVRIPVPVRIQSHEDPSVTQERDYEKLEKDFLALPPLTDVDRKNAFLFAYHIRSYSRWLSRFHSFARMLQLPGEYKLTSEDAAPVPSWTNGEHDRESENAGITFYETYASVSILRDGSIVSHDGYGSSIVMSNGNIQVSSARHLDLEAGGDIRMLAGNSIYIKARRNVEISATIGGIVLSSYAWLKMMCEKGTLWLRSNALTDKTMILEAKEEGGPLPEVAGYEKDEANGAGVLIEAVEGHAIIRSEMAMSLFVDGTPADEDDLRYNFTIYTKADTAVSGRRKVDLHTPGTLTLAGNRSVAIATTALISNAGEFYIGVDPEKPFLHLKGSTLYCDVMEGRVMQANMLRGPELGPVIPIPDPDPTQGLKTHFNHIGTLPKGETIEKPDNENENSIEAIIRAKALVNKTPELPWTNSFAGPLWGFPAGTEYVWDNRDGKVSGIIPETLTQQHLRVDVGEDGGDQWGGDGYELWDISAGGTIKGPRTKRNGGFGTREWQFAASDEGENLRIPSTVDPSDMGVPEITWKPKDAFSILVLKRPEL